VNPTLESFTISIQILALASCSALAALLAFAAPSFFEFGGYLQRAVILIGMFVSGAGFMYATMTILEIKRESQT
jgi:hypothetical protein